MSTRTPVGVAEPVDLSRAVALKPAAPTRGPAPDYNPIPNPGDPPRNDPRWVRVNALRQEAWDKGISRDELSGMECGGCKDQLDTQALRITGWNATH